LQFISWEPVKQSKLACWDALTAAIEAACPNAVMNQLPFYRRAEAVEHVTGDLSVDWRSGFAYRMNMLRHHQTLEYLLQVWHYLVHPLAAKQT
jgi:hypothetical protein